MSQGKIEYLAMLEQKKKLQEGLPHLYSYPFYPWQRDFFDSTNHMNFLTAANQVGKSSILQRKCIDHATDMSKWSKLWPTKPKSFLYFYPTKDLCTAEFEEQFVKEYLPRGEFRDHPVYGWRTRTKDKQIHYLAFNSGVTVYFMSYEMKASSLVARSIHELFLDEEVPKELWDELMMRIIATQGIANIAFTATLGQEYLRQTMEVKGKYEKFPHAFKRQVSMYDCMKYEDGTPSAWTRKRIENIKATCSSYAEIQRRVYGRFIVDTDRMYPSFSREVNLKDDHKLPKSWLVFSGIDIGSGGVKGHPAAIVFVGVKPDFSEGRVFLGWRGDGVETTAGDILNKYRELKGSMKPVGQFYDWQSKDFFTIACRSGEPVQPADKKKDVGEGILNTLFKNKMLYIYETDELMKLVNELENIKRSTLKTQRGVQDDFVDALRYACSKVPWDYTKVGKGVTVVAEEVEDNMPEREKQFRGLSGKDNGVALLSAEYDDMNEDYEFYGYD